MNFRSESQVTFRFEFAQIRQIHKSELPEASKAGDLEFGTPRKAGWSSAAQINQRAMPGNGESEGSQVF